MVKKLRNRAFTRKPSFTEYVLPVFAGKEHYITYKSVLYTPKLMFTNCLQLKFPDFLLFTVFGRFALCFRENNCIFARTDISEREV